MAGSDEEGEVLAVRSTGNNGGGKIATMKDNLNFSFLRGKILQRILQPLAYMLLLTVGGGCVSAYKHVLVSVVDSKTGAPIAGVKVRTHYFKRPLSLASTYRSQAVTDSHGHAMLVANYLPREPILFGRAEDVPFAPFYDVTVSNETYEADSSTGVAFIETDPIFTRSSEFLPTNPDITVDIACKADVERAQIERDQARKMAEQKAEELFQKSPDYWPEHGEGAYGWVKDDVGEFLIFKRWKAVTQVPLGTQNDIDSIRKAVLQHMRNPKARIGAIGWLSPTTVMVSSGWYEGPLASAIYTYVVRKEKDGWTVLTYYLEGVS